MTAYDLRARATAARSLAPVSQGGKGQLATLNRSTAGAYDPATSSASVTPATVAGSGLAESVVKQDRPGTRILAGDTKFLLSAIALDGSAMPEPAVGEGLTLADGKAREIVAVEPLTPAGTDILFTVYLRG